MRFSLKIFTWLGIPVFLHWSFGLILAYVCYIAYSQNMGWLEGLLVLGIFLSIFACVLLHEYGHAIAARRYGVGTQDIILTPIGGIARLSGMPQKPLEEFVVAIAGPLVNVAIVIVLVVGSFLLFEVEDVQLMIAEVGNSFKDFYNQIMGVETNEPPAVSAGLLWELVTVIVTANCFLFAFNLIPAFPMDGGRIFRALMETKVGKLTATKYASFFGQGIALLFMWQGFQNQPHTLALIGVFIFFAARKEYQSLRTQDFLQKTKVKDIMQHGYLVFPNNLSLQEAAIQLKTEKRKPIILLNDYGEPFGTVDLDRLRKGFAENNPALQLMDFYVPFIGWISSDTKLNSLYSIFQSGSKSVLAVKNTFDSGLVGILEPKDIEIAMRNKRWP